MSTTPKIRPHDALEFLTAEHKALLGMLRDYERDAGCAAPTDKGKAALRICHRLAIHCAIKEEIFHPAAKAALGDKAEPIDRAGGQIGTVRGLIKEVEGLQARDVAFDQAVKVLGDAVRQHFEAEESDIFSRLRHSKFDVVGTGEKLAARKLQFSTEPAGKAVIREAKHVLGG